MGPPRDATSTDRPTAGPSVATTGIEDAPPSAGPTEGAASATAGPPLREPSDELREGLTAFRGAAATRLADEARTPADALRAARARGPDADPVAYRLELEALLRRDPTRAVDVARLLANAMDADDGPLLFQTALALGPHADAETTAVLLAAIDGADPAARPHVVFALRGASTPEVDRALTDAYASDATLEVRAQAAFVLSERMQRIDPEERARILEVARAGIASDDPRTRAAAADVLGGAPLQPTDRDLLSGIVARGADPGQRLVALRALVTAGADVAELRDELTAIAADPSQPDDLRDLAGRLARDGRR